MNVEFPNDETPASAMKPILLLSLLPALAFAETSDGDGTVTVSGELKQWHKITLTLDGPFAREADEDPNPFTDHALSARFTHPSGAEYTVPGYFAADGDAANTSATEGTKWRVHFAPDRPGEWSYRIDFRSGDRAALGPAGESEPLAPYHGTTGSFEVARTGKSGRDFRAHGRLEYVGGHHRRFAGSGGYFLKAGPDAPETLLACADFDGTRANREDVPLKSWRPHVRDWREGDPTWRNGRGKGLVGALNYLAAKGMNTVSFLPYNAGGDGDNVWPFTARDRKFHYDCSKLDQWGVVFDHATRRGIHLHFKLQETEIDDDRHGDGPVPTSLDGGALGPERRLYCRELVARFGHALALTWNIGEENTQSPDEVKEMIAWIHELDPYDHHIVMHTYPGQYERRYGPLLGLEAFTGVSLQLHWDEVHRLTAVWHRKSREAGHPWVCANDEQGPASLGVPPDPGYPGDAEAPYDLHDIRKRVLWGNLMAGGAGVEYYFGYQLAQNDLLCEDWRSRDRSWDYARIALEFFRTVPFREMTCRDDLVDNPEHDNTTYCLAKPGDRYLVYLPEGGERTIDLPQGERRLAWFNPRTGERGDAEPWNNLTLSAPDRNDWLAIITPAP